MRRAVLITLGIASVIVVLFLFIVRFSSRRKDDITLSQNPSVVVPTTPNSNGHTHAPIAAYNLETKAFVTIASKFDLVRLQIFVGSVQHWHPGTRVIVYAHDFTRAQLRHVRNWQHVEVIETKWLLTDPKFKNLRQWIPLIIHDAAETFESLFFVSLDYYLAKSARTAADEVKRRGSYVPTLLDADGKETCCHGEVFGLTESSNFYASVLQVAAQCLLSKNQDPQCPKSGTDPLGAIMSQSDTCSCSSLSSSFVRKHKLTDPEDEAWVMYYHLAVRDEHLVVPDEELHPFENGKKPDSSNGSSNNNNNKGDGDEQTKPDDTVIVPPDKSHGHDQGKDVICFGVPSTTKGKDGNQVIPNVESLPVFTQLLKTILDTTEDEWNTYSWRLYLGVDIGDPIYDNHEQVDKVQAVFNDMLGSHHMDLKMKKFGPEIKGAPAWIWNGLFEQAIAEGCDYYYQINDDVEIITPHWVTRFVDKLKHSSRMEDFGATGPEDQGNTNTLTQSFASKLHWEIFQTYYPQSLKNWYSDDWMGHVYDTFGATFWEKDFKVRNTNKFGTRYHECGTCEGIYRTELENGRNRIQAFLDTHPKKG